MEPLGCRASLHLFCAQNPVAAFHRAGNQILGVKALESPPTPLLSALLSDQPLGGLYVVCGLWGELWTQTLTGRFHPIMQCVFVAQSCPTLQTHGEVRAASHAVILWGLTPLNQQERASLC